MWQTTSVIYLLRNLKTFSHLLLTVQQFLLTWEFMRKLTTLLVPVADHRLTVKLARSLHNWLLAMFLLFIWSSILNLQYGNSINIFTYWKPNKSPCQVKTHAFYLASCFLLFLKYENILNQMRFCATRKEL